MTSLSDPPSLENRISAATMAAASTVTDGSAPPLRLPARPHSPRIRLRSAWTNASGRAGLLRLAAPIAAAAAVVAVVATSLAVTGGPHRPAPTVGAGLAGVPRYYLTLVSYDSTGTATITATAGASASTAPASTASSPSHSADSSSPAPSTSYSSPAPTTGYSSPAASTATSGSSVLGTSGREYAVIQDAITGATVATVQPPRPFDTFDYATGAADDRTFVLAAQDLSEASGLGPCGPTRLFQARFNPTIRVVTLTPLPIPEFPATSQLDAIALSPDGTRLAVALESGQRCEANPALMLSPLTAPSKNAASAQEQVRVYALPSSTVKTWQSAPQWDAGGYVGPNAMSWTRSGMLAFNYPAAGGGSSRQGLWLLDTNAPGGSLLAHSRFAVSAYVPPRLRGSRGITSRQAGRWVWASSGVITPDGKTVIAPLEPRSARPGVTGGAIAEFAASTGKEFRVRWQEEQLTRDPFLVPYYSVVWSNSSGSVLVVVAPATRGGKAGGPSAYGVLSGNRFTPIPGAPYPIGLSLVIPTTVVF